MTILPGNPTTAEEPNKDPEKTGPEAHHETPLEPAAQDAAGFSEEYWNERRVKLREKHPELMEGDMDYKPENHQAFITTLSTRLKMGPDEFTTYLDAL